MRARSSLVDVQALEMDVGRAAKPERDHSGRRRGIGDAVDQDEGAGRVVFLIGVEGKGRGRGEIAEADLVEAQGLGREFAERIDVETMLQLGDRHRNGPRARLHEIGAAGQELVVAHPDEMRGELVGDLGPVLRIAQDIAARDVELVGKGEGDGIAGRRAVEVAVGGDDPRDPRRAARPGDDDFVAGADRSARDRPGKSAKIEMRAIDPLHRKAKRLVAAVFGDIDRLEIVEQRRSMVPGRIGALFEILSPWRAEIGMAHDRLEVERRGKGFEIGDDLVERRPRSKPVRSILLTASTTCRMPVSETIAAWRQVWVRSPLRASTSRIARSAPDAPVAMLRVYCSWPGVSAMMKERRGVET